MNTNRPVIRWSGCKPRSAPIPAARDPFVNTPLLRLTPDPNGLDRFWISSYNASFGALGVCVNEAGEHRIYPFNNFRHDGFYSAVQTGQDTLWLCGNLSRMVKLDLQTGKVECFSTDALPALVFAGMAYDKKSGKLFAVALPSTGILGVSFDTNTGKTCKIHRINTPEHYMRFSFPNGDGTYSIELQCPGRSFVKWDPRSESITTISLAENMDRHGDGVLVYRMIPDRSGNYYTPGKGWYEPKSGKFLAGPRPDQDDITWFARDRISAYGIPLGKSTVCRWIFKTGNVEDICSDPGFGILNTNLTRSGKLLNMNRDGLFSRYDARSGELELSILLKTHNIQNVDCVIRIDKNRILGTPFITQRFWETNLRTKKGFDCGRAAPGGGEILRVWKVGNKIYMAAYTGGELVEYDPEIHPHFPENPRVVAKPPTGMRPYASADDGERIFYSCNHHYGHFGSILTRYNTGTGEAFYRDDLFSKQQIISLSYEKASNTLLCGTSYGGEGVNLPKKVPGNYLARLNPDTCEVIEKCKGPAGSSGVRLIGPLKPNQWLGTCWGSFGGESGSTRCFKFNSKKFTMPEAEALWTVEGWKTGGWSQEIEYAGKPGFFVLKINSRIELWDMRKPHLVNVLGDSIHFSGFSVQDKDVLIWTAWDVFVLENSLDI